eukprot:TRINITY_DN3731_c1_g3_i1.p1 TRINITY_DN3731_c1_g3~~TRINITY_DN3731_c1_g3_i1.p1  ORF type:complete len:1037 (+),score=220.34 TRINITY_DN3731_c1_g3_i1:82-3111(+)
MEVKDKKEKKQKGDKEKGEKKDKKEKKEKDNKEKKEKKEKKDNANVPEAIVPVKNGLPTVNLNDVSSAIVQPEDLAPVFEPVAVPRPAEPEEEEEAAFWDMFGIGDDEAESAAGAGEAVDQSAPTASGGSAGESGVLQVPAETADELSRKIERIAMMTGASLTVRGGLLRITGTPSVRERAECMARGVIEKRVESDAAVDLTMVPVPRSWWEEGGNPKNTQGDRIEADEPEVLLFLEAAKQQRVSRYSAGQAVDAVWSGGGWHPAMVLGYGSRGKVKVRFCFDGSEEDVVLAQVSHSKRVGIFGPVQARLRAEVRVMTSTQASTRGIIPVQLRARGMPPGGPGLESYPLPPAEKWSAIQILRERNILQLLAKATGCAAIELFSEPPKNEGVGTKNFRRYAREEYCVLLAGDRNQRWLAVQILQPVFASLDAKRVEGLSIILAGEHRAVRVPKDIMSMFQANKGQSLRKMMEDHSCLIQSLGEREAFTERRGEESDDVVEMMLDAIRNSAQVELAIFGPVRNRFAVELKLRAMIESFHRGYHKVAADGVEITASGAIGIDKVWLTGDFETDSARRYADMLAGASGCSVESAGRLVFLAGTGPERARAREYIEWITCLRLRDIQPHIDDLESRKDLAARTVPKDVAKSDWLLKELETLSASTKTLLFFDDFEDEEEASRRLVGVGGSIVDKGTPFVTSLLDDCKQLVDKLLDAQKKGYADPSKVPVELKEPEKNESDNWWSNKDSDWKKDGWSSSDWKSGDGWNSWSDWNKKEDKVGVPPPSTPGMIANSAGVAPPATPGFPRGVAAPATPAPGGGVPPPATPAPGRGVPPPSTPAPGRVPAPATPAVPGLGGTAPPATPAFFGPHGSAAPATPAPGAGFGPHGAAAPSTPGILGGGGGVPPPATPAVPVRRIPAPQTPAVPGMAKPAVAAPQTPAFPGATSADTADPLSRKRPGDAPDNRAKMRPRLQVMEVRRDIVVDIPVDDGKGGEKMETRAYMQCLTWRSLHPASA